MASGSWQASKAFFSLVWYATRVSISFLVSSSLRFSSSFQNEMSSILCSVKKKIQEYKMSYYLIDLLQSCHLDRLLWIRLTHLEDKIKIKIFRHKAKTRKDKTSIETRSRPVFRQFLRSPALIHTTDKTIRKMQLHMHNQITDQNKFEEICFFWFSKINLCVFLQASQEANVP